MVTLLLGTQPIPQAQAATITVTNLNDSGVGSLRQAITDAVTGDTINFSVTGTITLTSGQLTITKNLTITGSGENSLNISGGGNFRVLQISLGPYNVTISDLTITNGSSSEGSGLYNESTAAVLLENVTFSNNTALSGGGISNFNSSPTLTNVTFSGNSATNGDGGGIYNYGSSPTLVDVDFNANSASYAGGGMTNRYNSNPTLTNVTFNSNSADVRGGGLQSESNSSPSLTNVTFSNNHAGSFGGGMLNYTGSPTLTTVTFDTNTAGTSGGGMENNDSSPTLTDVTFSSNSATSAGGGMRNRFNSSPTLTNVTFNSNSAPLGGGIYNDLNCDPMLTNVTISGNTADQGGGIYSVGNSPTLTNTILAGNIASNASPDCLGSINSGGYNLVGNASGCGFGNLANDQVGTAADPINPLLSGLSNNGGETLTRALLNGSPAIDQIPFGINGCGTTITSDQRGESRPFPAGGACDIGAYEFSPPTRLPDTGFFPGKITSLPNQPTEKTYADLGSLWLEVPKLGIQTDIVGIPAVGNSWDVSWLDSSVGYLQGSAFPTWQGNTILTGHVWDAINQPGLFINLKQLAYGDQIKIHAWGKVYIYEVLERKLVSPDDINEVMQHKDLDWVTLLTCENYQYTGESYNFRRIVQAVLVNVVSDP